jgi:hypothetical protein
MTQQTEQPASYQVCGSINIITYKGKHMNATEKFHIYKPSKQNQQIHTQSHITEKGFSAHSPRNTGKEKQNNQHSLNRIHNRSTPQHHKNKNTKNVSRKLQNTEHNINYLPCVFKIDTS